jgi:hypothetical protein
MIANVAYGVHSIPRKANHWGPSSRSYSTTIPDFASHAVRLNGWDQKELAAQKTLRSAETTWEYSVEVGLADNFDTQRIEITGGMLDSSLALWGRYGWELVTVIPHQERLLAFFKRPAKNNLYSQTVES